MSRPLFIYVNKTSLERPEVRAFIEFYLESGPKLVRESGYVPLTKDEYQDALFKIQYIKP